jgi:periplasmic protein CpxP/Spy
MTNVTIRRGGILVAAALALVPLAGVAQAPPPPPPPPPATTPAVPPTPEAAANARLAALQAQLRITDAQMPQWNAFAQTMRQNAISTDTLFRQRAQAVNSMSAVDNMKSYAQIAQAYADNTKALAQAFEQLYDALTAQQKQTIDTLFRQEAAKAAATQPGHP